MVKKNRFIFSCRGFGLGGTEAADAYLQEGVDAMVVIGSTLAATAEAVMTHRRELFSG